MSSSLTRPNDTRTVQVKQRSASPFIAPVSSDDARVKAEVPIDFKPDVKPNVKLEDEGEYVLVCRSSSSLLIASF
jgi:hypothetical protein